MKKQKSSSRKVQVNESVEKEAITTPPISKGRKSVFIAATLLLPLILLLLVELGFRFSGWGGYQPFLRPAGVLESGDTLIIVEPAASKPYFYSNPSRPGYADQSSFVMPKPENTFRIFLLGESAAKGYPQPMNLSMSSFLRAMLKDVAPEKNFEIINMGTTAVAGFPIIYMAEDALNYDPDLIISYTGNNEFFGAYGTASINSSGTFSPGFLKVVRWFNGLGMIQALNHYTERKPEGNLTLMEQMIGETSIPFDSGLREAAAANLEYSLGEISRMCMDAGVPLILCTTASNESGLYPMGSDDNDDLAEDVKKEIKKNISEATEILDSDPASAVKLLNEVLSKDPENAGATFLLAKATLNSGDKTAASKTFIRARDLDKMPWRPISLTEDAIRKTAKITGAVLCDIAGEFRKLSPAGASGWDLLDDHVHLSLRGQAEAAKLMTRSILGMQKNLNFRVVYPDSIGSWEEYALELGSNLYDKYRVDHTMRVLFNVSFLKRTNEAAFKRYNNEILTAEAKMSSGVLQTVREWQTEIPHAGGLRPICGMVAKTLVREKRFEEALECFRIARGQVPHYTSWYLEYVYFSFALKVSLNKKIENSDLDEARAAIQQGRFLLRNGYTETGLTERYTGRLHQLRGEWEEAIPYLLAARTRMTNEDLMAVDQALFLSYTQTGKFAEARSLVEEGVRSGSRFRQEYLKMLASLQKK